MAEEMSQNAYWDYVSVTRSNPEDKKEKDPFKETIKETFQDLLPYVNQLYWANAVVIYLNAYLGISQTKIAKLLGISQFGVSKRYRASKNKLKFVMTKPIKDRNKLSSSLNTLLPSEYAEPIIVFYSFNLISITCRTINTVGVTKINNNFIKGVDLLEQYALVESHEGFVKIMEEHNMPVPEVLDWIKYKTFAIRMEKFLRETKESCLYGNYFFKVNDNRGRKDFDRKCLFT